MDLFRHLAYEIEKGVRSLVLYTGEADEQETIEFYLYRKNIPFYIDKVGSRKINVFFGTPECLQMLQSFSTLKLNELTDEEDFILGILLGYDLRSQCIRYKQRKPEKTESGDSFHGLERDVNRTAMAAIKN